MPKTITGRAPGTAARRTMTAAARAAAKRAERGHLEPAREPTVAGRTVLIDAPKNGWEDPPEPSLESFEEDAPPQDSGRPRRRRLLTVVLGALSAAGLAAVAVLGWQYLEGRQAESARADAIAAARKAAPVVLSYDYRHLDRDFARARIHLTGDFRDEYGKTTKTVVGPTAEKYHGVVKAKIAAPATGAPAASVVSASPDEVVVLLFVNQVTESTQVSGARVDLNRVRMTMSRTGDGWKVSAVDAL
ncbi:hypothetical protein [Streptomyces viridochromogenes]|uniref:hypothetical protein n=1 Tax=Streptomyces viridochromogenes TaxID=1938 RepID=UPI00069CED7F|nr:hypothetical protein [Streptomyces viridochromogenes]KOG07108.1 hypothetical protein ADK35_44500 [Streptomyces viridochromogenes]KOG07202.1 hypothetical protein ADK36_44830 [Streptomyces viridochromogenes]